MQQPKKHPLFSENRNYSRMKLTLKCEIPKEFQKHEKAECKPLENRVLQVTGKERSKCINPEKIKEIWRYYILL